MVKRNAGRFKPDMIKHKECPYCRIRLIITTIEEEMCPTCGLIAPQWGRTLNTFNKDPEYGI